MLPLSWNTGLDRGVSAGSWGCRSLNSWWGLITNASDARKRGDSRGRHRSVSRRNPPGRREGRTGGLLIVVGTVHGSPPLSSAFLHPRYWPLWFGLGLLWLVRVQLPYPVLLLLGRGPGGRCTAWSVAPRDCRAQPRTVLSGKSPAEARASAEGESASSGIAFEMAMSWWWPKAPGLSCNDIEGLETCARPRPGRGVILMALHLPSPWRSARSAPGHTIDGMYREHDNPVFGLSSAVAARAA